MAASPFPPQMEAILSPLKEESSGGEGGWFPEKPLKRFTNAMIWDPLENKILLGWKKRGFAEGIPNGFGGKVDPEETYDEAALRELKEEAGISAPLKHVGTLLFTLEETEFMYYIQIYAAESYEGDPVETEEMRPQWFSLESLRATSENTDKKSTALETIPLDLMWADDRYWLPLLLQRKRFVGRADFAGSEMKRWWFGSAVE